jgi:hypothetical protein
VGTPGEAQVQFCEKKLCKVIATLKPLEKRFGLTVDELRDRIEKRYGPPKVAVNTIAKCRGPLSPCLMDDAEVHFEWVWETGHAIELVALPGITKKDPPALLMTHTRHKERVAEKKSDPGLPAL